MVEQQHDTRSGSQDAPRGFEELLSRCIGVLATDGAEALEPILVEHPDDAERLRERLAELERLGLLDVGAQESHPTTIGGHHVLRRLGSGGMGDVFLATDPDSGRAVALKWARLAPPRQDADARARVHARFEREARAIGRLSHPGIATVHQVGEHEGRPWFTMDVVEGITLSEVLSGLQSRGIPPSELRTEDVVRVLETVVEGRDEAPQVLSRPRAESYVEWAVRVTLEVAGALAHAHEQGIVHRDVKPSNIMIRFDGEACLFDLGLAHLEDMPTITRSGDFAGTPYYVAPEQVEGRHDSIDGRTDVWGLAVTLYELLALRRPFEGEATPEILRRIVEREPPAVGSFHEGLPADLAAILSQALEKEPKRRYRDMQAFAADLERFLSFRPVVARPPGLVARAASMARRRPALAAAWALAALVAVGLPLGLFLANQAIRVEAQRASNSALEAREQADARARVVEHLVDLFRAPGAGDEGMVAALDGQLERVQAVAGTGALARATMLEAAGTIYRNLGLYERALPPLDRALSLRTSAASSHPADTASLLEVLAGVHLELEHDLAAELLCRRGLRELEATGAREQHVVVEARLLLGLARSLDPLERAEEVADCLQRAELGLSQAGTSADRIELQLARGEFGLERAELAVAREAFEHAHALRRASWLPEPASLALDLERIAAVAERLGDEGGASDRRAQARKLRLAEGSEGTRLTPPPLRLVPAWREAFDETFQVGITALQARRAREAIECFQTCLELNPSSNASAYNVACGHALAGDVDTAFVWIERARDRGWGLYAGALELLRRDPDLAGLREHPRFGALVAGLEQDAAATREFTQEPVLWVPDADARGLLVVLHAEGATKLDAARGPWRALAERHDMALLAPSGNIARQERPELGLAWYQDLADFAERPWSVERSVVESIEAARAQLQLGPEQVVLAGEGAGGCVALDLALRAPGTLRGVLVLDAPLLLEGAERRARVAAAMGLEVHAAYRADRRTPNVPEGVTPASSVQATGEWLAGAGLIHSASLLDGARTGDLPARWDDLLGR